MFVYLTCARFQCFHGWIGASYHVGTDFTIVSSRCWGCVGGVRLRWSLVGVGHQQGNKDQNRKLNHSLQLHFLVLTEWSHPHDTINKQFIMEILTRCTLNPVMI